MPQLSLVGYHLTYDNEFTNSAAFVTSANGSVGFANSYSFGRSLPSNGEAEYYVDPNAGPSPFSVQNGELTITAQPTLAGQYTAGLPYSSGLISTENSFSQNTGYFEIRAQTPYVQGFWSAFWMLPVGGGGNPELDVFEQPNLEGNNAYWSYANPSDLFKGGGFNNTGENLSAGYHAYGLLWTTTSVSFFLDGLQIGPTVDMPPDFTQKMYMIANLAVGGAGSWPGQPTSVTTAQYKIDYIRAYSLDPLVPTVALQTISSPDAANTTPSYTAPLPIIPATLGTGPDTLILQIAEDYWQGDAQFTISIGGVQQGGVQIATAANAAGQSEAFVILGNFGTNQQFVTINYLNPASGGLPSLTRNLYVLGATLNGTTLPIGASTSAVSVQQTFNFTAPPHVLPAVNVTPALGMLDVLTLSMGETPILVDAQFTISVDGVQQGGVQTTTALASSLQTQAFVVNGDFGIGAHVLSIHFLNPPGALTLYSATLNGTILPGVAQTFTTSTPLVVPFIETSLPVTTIGTGLDVLMLALSEDAYLVNAQFTVSVDGVQQGGIQSVLAGHALGQSQSFAINGTYAVGPHIVTVNFLNDAYGGTTAMDRNLYVLGAQLNGVAITGSALNEYSGGPQSFGFTGTTIVPPPAALLTIPTPATVIGSGADTLALVISEDAYLGNAQFTVAINGIQQGGIQTAIAANAAPYTPLLSQSQVFDIQGSFTGTNIVTVNFLNDSYGGSTGADRNLYILGATLNGAAIAGSVLNEYAGGPQSFSFVGAAIVPPTAVVVTTAIPAAPTVIGAGADTLALSISEDAYLGDALFTVSINGVQQGGIQTAIAANAAPYTPLLAQSQEFDFKGSFTGINVVTVNFLNDIYGGSSTADRNLYVQSATIDGIAIAGGVLSEKSGGPQSFSFTEPTAPVVIPPVVIPPVVIPPVVLDSVTFSLTESAYLGDARVALSLDGVLLGSPTVAFLTSGNISEAFTFTGDFGGSTMVHVATVDLLNPASGGLPLVARGVLVQAITFDGAANTILPTSLYSNVAANFSLPIPIAAPI